MNRSWFRRASVAAAVAAGALTFASCGGGSELPGYGSGVSPEEAAPEESTTPESTPSPSEGSAIGSTEDSTGTASADAMLTVTDVRVTTEEDVDRVELVLDGVGAPGWHVGYVDEAVDPGKGDPVAVEGDSILQVHLTGTAMPMDSGVTEYDGAPVPGPEGGAVTEVVYRFVFEGTTTAFVGVDREPRPFTVSTETDPTRVVIDVGR